MLLLGVLPADMAELVDAPDLGSGFARSEGSSPFIRILLQVFSTTVSWLYARFNGNANDGHQVHMSQYDVNVDR